MVARNPPLNWFSGEDSHSNLLIRLGAALLASIAAHILVLALLGLTLLWGAHTLTPRAEPFGPVVVRITQPTLNPVTPDAPIIAAPSVPAPRAPIQAKPAAPDQAAGPDQLPEKELDYIAASKLHSPPVPISGGDESMLNGLKPTVGSVRIRVYVGVTGTLDRVEIVSALPDDAEAAQRVADMIKATAYLPGSLDGVHVRSYLDLEFSISPVSPVQMVDPNANRPPVSAPQSTNTNQ